jgi:hypothetical protein
VPRLIVFDWFTSTNRSATVIHEVDHEATQLIRQQRFLVLRIVAKCGHSNSPKFLALLTYEDAQKWWLNYGELRQKYGPRERCRWCS